MNNHNFKIVNGDTDSIMFCKADMTPFTKEYQEELINEINSLLPGVIKFKNDGTFKKVIVLKTKNYIMVDNNGKIKLKGSALKSSTLEPILKQMLNEMIQLLIEDNFDGLKFVYARYAQMVENITDIAPWCSKKTLSPTTYDSERKNETDIIDAIAGKEYVSGDRVYVFVKSKIIETGELYKVGAKKGQPKTKEIKSLCLKEDFTGDYCKEHYAKRVFEVANRFAPVLGEDFFNVVDN